MADEAARRRELRRQKILQNADERKRKIFGQCVSDSEPNGYLSSTTVENVNANSASTGQGSL